MSRFRNVLAVATLLLVPSSVAVGGPLTFVSSNIPVPPVIVRDLPFTPATPFGDYSPLIDTITFQFDGSAVGGASGTLLSNATTLAPLPTLQGSLTFTGPFAPGFVPPANFIPPNMSIAGDMYMLPKPEQQVIRAFDTFLFVPGNYRATGRLDGFIFFPFQGGYAELVWAATSPFSFVIATTGLIVNPAGPGTIVPFSIGGNVVFGALGGATGTEAFLGFLGNQSAIYLPSSAEYVIQTTVPEPNTLTLVIIIGAGWAVRRRFRRRVMASDI